MPMNRKNTLTLDPHIESQMLEQFDIQPEKVKPYLEHPERLSTFMDFRVDFAFKYILGHKPILLKLINDILPVQVEDIEYLSNEIPVMSIKEKRSTFDVICTSRGSGEKFIAEMQCIPDADMDDRLLFYGCSLVHSQIERGDDSYLLRPVLCSASQTSCDVTTLTLHRVSSSSPTSSARPQTRRMCSQRTCSSSTWSCPGCRKYGNRSKQISKDGAIFSEI